MQYFFLSEGWTIGRVWEPAGVWSLAVWRREPMIERTTMMVVEQSEQLWLYQVEDSVLMVEVKPDPNLLPQESPPGIGQVVLKRLMSAEQVLAYLMGHGDIQKIELVHASLNGMNEPKQIAPGPTP